jgi:hypothetical protein
VVRVLSYVLVEMKCHSTHPKRLWPKGEQNKGSGKFTAWINCSGSSGCAFYSLFNQAADLTNLAFNMNPERSWPEREQNKWNYLVGVAACFKCSGGGESLLLV